jgi:hypothetical protein
MMLMKEKKPGSLAHSCIGDVVYERYETTKNQMLSFKGSSSWKPVILCGQSVLINLTYTYEFKICNAVECWLVA